MARMTPSEAFVETLVSYGVTDVFGIVGSAFMDSLDIFPAAGIRFIPTVHEQGAAHMADGYARVSGRHGVCIGQNGPGITNFVTAIAAAYWAHSPVVAITPETGSNTMGLGGFQETNQLPIFSGITKYQGHVSGSARMAEFTARCFDIAMAERGPTQLNIPRDFFYGDINVDIKQPQVIERGPGGSKSLDDATRLLADAEFPVIISGGGVIMANAVSACVELAEYLSAPVVNSYLHNDSFPANHPLWAGPLGYQGSKAGMHLLSQADVVLALGTRLGPFGTLPQYGIDYWPTNAKIIQVDVDHRKIGLVKKISVGISADAGEAASAILERLKHRENIVCLNNRDSRVDQITTAKHKWETELNNWSHETDEWSQIVSKEDEGLLHPRQVLRELEKATPSNAAISTDIGNICSVSNSYLRFNDAPSFFAAMSFGNCGYAFPTVIGVKQAAPERPAIAYVGDGAWAMSMVEILTCVRENIPVTSVVFNNRQWGAEKKNQVDFYGRRFEGVNLESPSWAGIAKSMGAEGIVVDQLDMVGDALQSSLKAQSEGKTTIIEIMCTRELGDPFRRDALSRPVRHLDKYKQFV